MARFRAVAGVRVEPGSGGLVKSILLYPMPGIWQTTLLKVKWCQVV
ncbi:MAG: hypothetical protein KDJ52_01845 [Anaerolineae bacterium]|nr:hypothetical protein [Anaerolineae bacterium]